MWSMLLAANPIPNPYEGTRSALRRELALHLRQQRVHGTIDVLVGDDVVEGVLHRTMLLLGFEEDPPQPSQWPRVTPRATPIDAMQVVRE